MKRASSRPIVRPPGRAGAPGRLAAWIVVALAVSAMACARPLEVDPIPPTADPGQQIAELGLALSDARNRELGLLSPSWFRRADDAHAEALRLQHEGDEIAEILAAVAEGRAALERAEASAEVARATLGDALAARARALDAGAATLGAPFDLVDARFRVLTDEIETNDLAAARASRDQLAARYRELELRAIKEQTLGEARAVLLDARQAGAEERVPTAYADAAERLAEADAFIERQRYADEALKAKADVAGFYARRVAVLNEAAAATSSRGPEADVLERERRLHRLGQAFGLPDRRDWTFEERWSAIHSAAESAVADRDFVVRQNARLRDGLTSAHDRIAALTGENRSLERERDFEALYAKARNLFGEDEAEVYRQGDRLIIRLRALEFPVGEAEIPNEDYSLLAKVQRAIRTFGRPTVTIEGHTDSTGSVALNERLSQQRAEAVRDFLVANHTLPEHRIFAVGVASERPLASNETAAGRALNRRIDVILDTRQVLLIAGGPELSSAPPPRSSSPARSSTRRR